MFSRPIRWIIRLRWRSWMSIQTRIEFFIGMCELVVPEDSGRGVSNRVGSRGYGHIGSRPEICKERVMKSVILRKLEMDNQKLCARTITSLAAQSVFGASGAWRKLGMSFTPGFVMWRANIPREVTTNRKTLASVCTTHLELNFSGTSRRRSFRSAHSIPWFLL